MNQNSSKLMEDIKKFLTGKKTDYVEIGGHRFAENIKVGQNALVLNGTGVRTQSDKPIYAVALYLPAKTHRQDTSRALLGRSKSSNCYSPTLERGRFHLLYARGHRRKQ